jgi:hypothetical protein
MESSAPTGRIFRQTLLSRTTTASLINHFRIGMVIAFTSGCQGDGVSMITSAANSGTYVRSAQSSPLKMMKTTADAQAASEPGATPPAESAKLEHPDLDFRTVDVSQSKITPLDVGLRDLFATVCWEAQLADSTDNASQNIYATVKVDGKVVATLYNGGSSIMTNEAAEKVGDLKAPPGLSGGPDLAQWRAARIAEAMGGTVEKAPSGMAQSAWKPRESTSSNYSRAQLDAAFEAMMAEQQNAIAQWSASYQAPREPSRGHTDFSA